MAFTSFNFLIFFPIVLLVFYLTPSKYRWVVLLGASYFFYINIKPVYAILLVGITLSTYLFTRLIDSTDNESKKARWMWINIVLILMPLIFFKYLVVFNNELIGILDAYHLRWPLPEMKFLLPIGISYYTFMCIGYTIDVYNEEMKAEKNVGRVALFVSFFPLVLSGPIERAKNMIPQLANLQPLNYQNISAGFKIMLWGYFLKLVVADRIGIHYVDMIFGDVEGHNGTSLMIASLLYPFQVYADLGGYSLIAIGVSKALGLTVMQNFNRPFFATSMADFWRRWHISLITWFTDYVYTPLSFHFRSLGKWGIVISLMIIFFLSGIWHSAELTLVFWGLLQGTYLSIEALTQKKRSAFENRYNLNKKPLYLFFCMVVTFLLFAISQIFGRAETISESFLVITKIFTSAGVPYLDLTTLMYAILGISILLFKDFKDEFFAGKLNFFSSPHMAIRYASYLAVIFIIILFGVFQGNSFIYFQF